MRRQKLLATEQSMIAGFYSNISRNQCMHSAMQRWQRPTKKL